MAHEFRMQRRVAYAETDAAGIAHHTHFFLYMEEAEHAFIRSLGLSIFSEEGDRVLSWPRVSCSFDFDQPLRYDDAFDVCLSVERVGDKSVTYRVEIEKDGEIVATGRSTTVCCALLPDGSIESVAIPDAFRSQLEVAPPTPGS